MNPRLVVCAAIRSRKTGRIICGARHYDGPMRQWFVRKPNWFQRIFQRKKFIKDKDWYGCDQGFIDQHGIFMDRSEAWDVAMAAGQIRYPIDHGKGILYSENLY